MKVLRLILILYCCTNTVQSAFGQWSSLQGGPDFRVNSMYVDSVTDLLFVGGEFHNVDGMSANNIATWDGNNWQTFGSNEIFSSPGAIGAICRFNNSIVVGGNFDSIGQTRVNNIAKWDGNTWSPLDSGLRGDVYSLIVYNNELYAGGHFNHSGTNFVSCFARWNGTTWNMITNLIGSVYTMCIFDNKLIVGGSFYDQNITSIYNIVAIDSLISIDTSFGYFNDPVLSIKNIDDTLWCTGTFTQNIDTIAKYISLYYDSKWHSIGNPTGGSNTIRDVNQYNNEKYFCGYFTNPPDLCKYNGVDFDSVITTVNGYFEYLINYKNSMYVSGYFYQLNNLNINQIAKYTLPTINTEEILVSGNLNIFPNPLTDSHLNIESINDFIINIEIFNMQGDLLSNYKYNDSVVTLNFKHPPGFYLIKVQLASNKFATLKLVKL